MTPRNIAAGLLTAAAVLVAAAPAYAAAPPPPKPSPSTTSPAAGKPPAGAKPPSAGKPPAVAKPPTDSKPPAEDGQSAEDGNGTGPAAPPRPQTGIPILTLPDGAQVLVKGGEMQRAPLPTEPPDRLMTTRLAVGLCPFGEHGTPHAAAALTQEVSRLLGGIDTRALVITC